MKPNRYFSSYFILIAFLLVMLAVISLFRRQENDYTQEQFIKDLDSGVVREVIISPNRETPTGYAKVVFGDVVKELYATDIREWRTSPESMVMIPLWRTSSGRACF